MTHIRSALVSLIVMVAPAALAPAAIAQSQPGFATQDPMISRLQSRADAAEDSVRRLTGQMEQAGFQNTQLRRQIDAQKATIDTLEARLAALDDRLKRLESLADAPIEAASQAAIAPDEATISLVGPTEPMTHEAKAARRDDESAADPDAGLVSKSSAPVKLAETPEALFLQAKGLMTRGDYPAAEAAFTAYLEQYRSNDDAPNAQYWLGEVLFIQEAYAEALEAYVGLASDWPQARRAPDAWYKLARTLGKLGDTGEACAALDEMTRLYPKVDPLTRSGAAQERENLKCPARKGG